MQRGPTPGVTVGMGEFSGSLESSGRPARCRERRCWIQPPADPERSGSRPALTSRASLRASGHRLRCEQLASTDPSAAWRCRCAELRRSWPHPACLLQSNIIISTEQQTAPSLGPQLAWDGGECVLEQEIK